MDQMLKNLFQNNILAWKKYLIRKYASWNVDIEKDQVIWVWNLKIWFILFFNIFFKIKIIWVWNLHRLRIPCAQYIFLSNKWEWENFNLWPLDY